MKGRGRDAGVARLQQRLGDAAQENARLRLGVLRSEAGQSQLRAELERLREDLHRRAQRRRREQQALRELAEENLAFTSYIGMLQSTNRSLRESNGNLRSALVLGSCGGPRASSACSEDSASPSDAGCRSLENACSASPAQDIQDPQAGEVEGCCHPAQRCCKRKLSAFAPEGSGMGEQPVAPSPIYRLVLAGDSGAGKSSFLLRLCRNEFRGDISSTLGLALHGPHAGGDTPAPGTAASPAPTSVRPTACCSCTTSAPRAASSASAGGSRTSRAPGPHCPSCWWAIRATCGPGCRRRRGSTRPTDRGWPRPTTACSARPAPRTARMWWKPCCTSPEQ